MKRGEDMILKFINSLGKEVKIGTLIPLNKDVVKLFVHRYEVVWLEF